MQTTRSVADARFKRNQAAAALAIGLADQDTSAISLIALVLANHVENDAGATVAPALAVNFAAPPITQATGTSPGNINYNVRAQANFITAAHVGDTCTVQLQRDGVGIGPLVTVETDAASGRASVAIDWLDLAVAAGPHTYSIEVTDTVGAGHTVAFNAANSASIVVQQSL
jgi:hypothetical protein